MSKQKNELTEGADDMLAIMLSLIDSAMHCTDAEPAVLRITPQELSSWATAVERYETARFPLEDHLCPYCGLDPYHYEDVGTAFPARVAIVCCDAAVEARGKDGQP